MRMGEQRPQDEPAVRDAWCSFCRKNHRVVGPLAEGPDQVYICYACVRLCADLIEREYERRGVAPKESHD
jgi:ATP-dependent Clp protease ATP-binding subunit ClpX